MTARDMDATYMRRCLELARRGEGKTSPNPMVGCVIVDARGQVIAEGWHRGPGTRHAEADALARLADQRAPGTWRSAAWWSRATSCARSAWSSTARSSPGPGADGRWWC